MQQTTDEYIRQHIQYENLTRANQFFISALFVVPVGLFALDCIVKKDMWRYGNTWIWTLVSEILFAIIVFAIHRKAEDRGGDHRYFLYKVWGVYLLATDLLAFNLTSSVIAQILLWSATLKFITSYLSKGKGANAGLLLRTTGRCCTRVMPCRITPIACMCKRQKTGGCFVWQIWNLRLIR